MKYPRIEKYMNDNGLKLAGLAKQCNIPYPTMWRITEGKREISKSNIDKILRVTGMTYEECFAETKEEDWREHFLNRFLAGGA